MNEKFITFEGGEGAGKTSVILELAVFLKEEGFDFITTREPGGIQIAESIRQIILDTNNTAMDGRTEALLYAAARRQHLVEKVIPELNASKIVLCDRFLDSSLVYQGIARAIGFDEVLSINNFAIENCMPKLTFYFDIEPEKGLARIAKNKDREINRLDKENLDFHYKVREGYLRLLAMFPERIIRIDAERPLEEVVLETKKKLTTYLNLIMEDSR
ncbi:dTMP kinase [Anaerobacillus isosaccharinicus]|uniref:Thymidylate kinase n=1 Tax=Anaerobacillus isosaccharinicus TaxID=1532552 RepID=A0A7S7LAI7_9BACI|nr:dTMP kinase [Anaerobacillus isosaccharinicus]MBA5584150.1 dTMP kinase [Anaerobacillus isosaccharinicus]QOY37441.1 dTMP kinase [Anaerobacillus isosaccharinicus]